MENTNFSPDVLDRHNDSESRFSVLPSCEKPRQLLRLVAAIVTQVFMVRRADLLAPSRGVASVALARQVAMYLAHVDCGVRLSEVGRGFGRDRTTVAHACIVVENRRDDPSFDMTLELLAGILARMRDICFPRHSGQVC